MLYVLSKEESFSLMNSSFKKLREWSVIDLTVGNERFPAVVTCVYRDLRAFDVLPLRPDEIKDMITARLSAAPMLVKLPDNPDDKHPMWNVMEVQSWDKNLPQTYREDLGGEWKCQKND